MAFANGYTYRKRVTLAGSALTNYTSALDDGIKINIGAGTDTARNVFIDSGKVQSSFIDVLLTDSADNTIPFHIDPFSRKPNTSCVVVWEKASVAASEELWLYYGKADAEYAGANLSSYDNLYDNSLTITPRGWLNNSRGDYIPADGTSDLVILDGFMYLTWVENETVALTNPRVYAAKFDTFTKTIVDKKFVFLTPQQDESHNLPVIGHNANNEIFIFCSGFNTPTGLGVKTTKSATPFDLDFGAVSTIPQSIITFGLLYLKFRLFSDGVMRVYGRDLSHYYIQSDDNGATWNTAVEVYRPTVGVPPDTDRTYTWSSRDPVNPDDIHFAACNSIDAGDSNLYYFYEDYSTGTYFDAAGNTLALPILPNSSALIEAAAARHPNNYGPYIDDTGAPVISYSADFSGSYINIKRWNGTTWDQHVIATGGDANQYINRAIFWEVGATKHVLLHKRPTGVSTVCDILEYTATDWAGPWTLTGQSIASGTGDFRAIIFKGQNVERTWPRFGILPDTNDGRLMLYELGAAAYTNNWLITGDVQRLNGRIEVNISQGQTPQSKAIKAFSSANPVELRTSVSYTPIGFPWISQIGGIKTNASYNVSPNDAVGIALRSDAEFDLYYEVANRLNGVESPRSVANYDVIAAQPNNLKINWNATGVTGEIYSITDPETALFSDTLTATTGVVNFVGFSEAFTGTVNTNRTASYELGALQAFDKQTAPTYQTWSAEETNANNAPTANAGPDQTGIAAGATVTLTGLGSTDPNGDTLTYLWTPPAGITLSSNTVAQPTFTAPTTNANQTLTFSLVVNDGTESSAPDTVDIGVLADTTAPVITLLGSASVTVTEGDTYTDAGATAFDNVDGNITANIVTTNPVNTVIPATYTVTYNVSDSAGNAAIPVTRTVIVQAQNNPPTVTITAPTTGIVGQAVTFTANATDPDIGATFTYLWSSGETTQAITVTPTVAGTLTRSVTANDGIDNSNTATANVEISSAPTPPSGNVWVDLDVPGAIWLSNVN